MTMPANLRWALEVWFEDETVNEKRKMRAAGENAA
jgi:hypothetical protein